MRRILRGRAAGYALALGVVGAVVAGAWLHSPAVMAAGPLGVIALVVLVAFRAADARAEQDFFVSFSRARGLRYVGRTVLLPPRRCWAPAAVASARTGWWARSGSR